jgi:undecaprenyl-diphosphatase
VFVLFVAIGLGLVAGLAVATVVRAWPAADPASPAAATKVARVAVTGHPRIRTFLQARRDPSVVTGLALTVAVAITVLGGVAVGVLLWMVRANAGVARLDRGASTWGATHASDASTTGLKWLTELGATPFVAVLVLATAALDLARTRRFTALVFLSVVILGQNALMNGIKVIVERARPDIDQLVGAAGTSFPSGHSSTAAAAYLAVALVLGRDASMRQRALLAGGATAIAVTVASSRVLLGVHWLTDVLAGLALGWAWFALCSIAFGGRFLRFGAPVEVAERASAISGPTPPAEHEPDVDLTAAQGPNRQDVTR